ncbi:MAG: DotU family type IV/VI secretion system protein [Isosphaeraceae bacterium]
MNKPFGRIVYKVFGQALDIKDRLDRGESPGIEAVRQQLIAMIRSESEGRRLPDYLGDGVFLGARYALACWVDELFIIHCQPPWADDWKERTLEFEIFGTNVAATKFWEQADIVLRHPGAARTPTQPGLDAVETFFLCTVLGFRGTYFDNLAKVRQYVEEMRPMITRPSAWQPPRDLGVQTNVSPLVGRETLRRVVGIYGGLALVVVLVLLALYRF